MYNDYTEDQQTGLDQMKANAQIYRDLTKSIAPQVYGHDDIKRAVLLMLFGGVHKTTKEVKSSCCIDALHSLLVADWVLACRVSSCVVTSMLPLLEIHLVANLRFSNMWLPFCHVLSTPLASHPVQQGLQQVL